MIDIIAEIKPTPYVLRKMSNMTCHIIFKSSTPNDNSEVILLIFSSTFSESVHAFKKMFQF